MQNPVPVKPCLSFQLQCRVVS